MSFITSLFLAFGLVVFVLGLQTLLFYPLALYYEWWKRGFFKRFGNGHTPFVSVIVPAYNEETTIALAVESILKSDYPHFEVIVVNDGSEDKTEEQLTRFSKAGKIIYVRKPNGGKASALNRGIREAHGEIVFFTDADSFFRRDTIRKIARWFVDPSVHAVCGNDEPIAPSTAMQKLLAVTTHIGSGFVRRALSVMQVLPIISGNSGAVRKEYLEKVNGFSEMWGEDLDLTFKLQKAGARIVFDPEAIVACDVPAGFQALWRQRVRWMRSFLKICARHKELFFTPDYAPFSFYLPINWLNMVVVPLMQIATAVLLPVAVGSNIYRFGGALDVVAYLGIALFFAVAFFGTLLDKAYHHLKYIPLYGWLIIPFSYFFNAVLIYSVFKELGGATEVWHKTERRQPAHLSFATIRLRHLIGWTGAGVGAIALFFFIVLPNSSGRDHIARPDKRTTATVAIATHFDAWQKPEDAINSIINRNNLDAVTMVGVGAGRYEWNFFRWENHESTWSNDQKLTDLDLLKDAVDELHGKEKRVVSILDFYAPTYLKEHPAAAAIDADGRASLEQVCFMELTEGEYGRGLIAMATYLAQHYDLDGISLTELEYNRYCYDDRCLKSFEDDNNTQRWPHHLLSLTVDRENPMVGEWRSRHMSRFLKQIADSVHKYGKKLFVDVPAHENTLESQGLQCGLYYPALLEFSDALIVWDYFYLDGRSPSSSRDIAQFFTSRYDPDRIIISIGLWGAQNPVSADELSEAVRSAQHGGARNIWVTPNHLLTDAHWRGLVQSLGYGVDVAQ